LEKGGTSNPILLYHLAPHQHRYEGIDGNCHERKPSRVFNGILSGMLALILGLRISYCRIVKGDHRTYFYGLIGWKFLMPFCFLANMFGFGALLECVFYFSNPCLDDDPSSVVQIHRGNSVSQKVLT